MERRRVHGVDELLHFDDVYRDDACAARSESPTVDMPAIEVLPTFSGLPRPKKLVPADGKQNLLRDRKFDNRSVAEVRFLPLFRTRCAERDARTDVDKVTDYVGRFPPNVRGAHPFRRPTCCLLTADFSTH